MVLVKGVSKRVVVVNSPDKRVFEQAIFIVRDEALRGKGVSAEDILKEACSVADRYMTKALKKRRGLLSEIPAPLFAAFGAAATAAAWLATIFIK